MEVLWPLFFWMTAEMVPLASVTVAPLSVRLSLLLYQTSVPAVSGAHGRPQLVAHPLVIVCVEP